MDDRTHALWSQGLGFWFRLWQVQFEQTLKIWVIATRGLPRPTAADLAAEAEKMREIVPPAEPLLPPPAGRIRRVTATHRPAPATVH